MRVSKVGRKKADGSGGFTLLELLVVIGIITILIGIALPAIRGIQRAAKTTTTTNLLNTIATAIDQYQGIQRDWPGFFDFEDRASGATGWDVIRNLDNTTSAEFQYATKPLKPTRGEELLLCLSGGVALERSVSPPFAVIGPNFFYNPDDLDRGHISLSPKNRGRFKAFMPAGTPRSDTKATARQYRNDSAVPEYVDAFGTPLLYVRAYKGIANTKAYYTYNTGDKIISGGQLLLEAQRYVDDEFILFPPTYLESETLPGQTRNQDRYVLISAGPDKKFGTGDDVTNFGTPKLLP